MKKLILLLLYLLGLFIYSNAQTNGFKLGVGLNSNLSYNIGFGGYKIIKNTNNKLLLGFDLFISPKMFKKDKIDTASFYYMLDGRGEEKQINLFTTINLGYKILNEFNIFITSGIGTERVYVIKLKEDFFRNKYYSREREVRKKFIIGTQITYNPKLLNNLGIIIGVNNINSIILGINWKY